MDCAEFCLLFKTDSARMSQFKMNRLGSALLKEMMIKKKNTKQNKKLLVFFFIFIRFASCEFQ